MKNKKWVSYIVIGYMLFALLWWSILLYQKNHESFTAKVELMKIQSNVPSDKALAANAEYQSLYSYYKRQANMILGEGIVFGFLLLLGFWLIQRAFNKELAASKQQTNFLLSVTHELKSPLTSIKLGLETLKKRELSHQLVQDIAETSLSESDRLQLLIEDLLLSAKLENTTNTYQLVKVDWSKELIMFVNQFQSSRSDIKIKTDVSPDICIYADANALYTIHSNLVENAAKYGERSDIDVSLSKHKDVAILQIRDEGIGIRTEDKDKIFNKFYRVGSEETRTSKGTGLGLYICNRIVAIHKGQIKVNDNSPKGSIFEVSIPLFT